MSAHLSLLKLPKQRVRQNLKNWGKLALRILKILKFEPVRLGRWAVSSDLSKNVGRFIND